MSRLLLLNGPNMNLLGEREPDLYGVVTLASIEERCARLAGELGHTLECFQSNAEHELIQRVQAAPGGGIGAIVVNPAAFTHSSIALRDALTAVGIPFIEVHLSNVHGREGFRRRSYFSAVAAGVISGLGPIGYELAIRAADALLRGPERN
ncbi:type II 3-dehydroquinate dehydratase [Wenzhouxiangella sp. XN24]|uniref:type II 3-dehydroquinate dehydratase n=1 Tax=Wenzhouxiangella sp. XN24 TaxID=2713569 RepID=UPI0013EA3157|nr:type II 3-dehydroquinate dehydratase [Wenzhouxiangella sp. XN24]NGX15147.1 type II 3-dehydroquinate dehydratase [Wenzhouxiangella sp. XN24]